MKMKLYQIIGIALFIAVLSSCTKETTETYERFYFKNNGADLAVQVDGNRASKVFILLLHGGPGGGSSAYNTGRYSELIEKEYAVVYLDQRGQGASQGNYSRDDVTLQQFSDDIYALARFLKQKYGQDISLFLMGHSWGGTTGTHALLNTEVQTELNGWIESNGAHDIPLLNKEAIKMFIAIGEEEINLGRNVEQWQEIVDFATAVDTNNITVEEGGQINGYGFEAEGLIEDIYPANYDDYFREVINTIPTAPSTSVATWLSNMLTANAIMEETENSSMTNDLDNIIVPSLFLWGKYDFVVPPALGVSAYNRVSATDKELIIFEHSGHSPMDNEPDDYTNAVIDFVERNK